ncbi:MAG: DUF5615 family PIN-like protein [Candidatus Methylomirabilia bacterium]
MNFLLDNDVPEELSYLLEHLRHQVSRVRETIPREASDAVVLDYAFHHDLIVITCNRDDFLRLVRERPHHGVVIVIRRRSRAAERAALLRLVEGAGAEGLAGNILPPGASRRFEVHRAPLAGRGEDKSGDSRLEGAANYLGQRESRRILRSGKRAGANSASPEGSATRR